ncbi:single-stranded DNA-binding protein [Mycoplasma seminis]|uniref:Single-stranded DNA-binding protein n=1 Tax=Mycoplasma seminis TaxID=512749 RepID=A0ABY9HAD7_9MOLU|nr:single-stranded DNA-binding protein [Mycoplasma seminis]WLP85216.1 single-stranded DNA-binding protein [Mycoplasma seminis]
MNKVFLSGFVSENSVKKIPSEKAEIYTFQIRCKRDFSDGSDFINITTFNANASYFEKYYKSNKFIELVCHISQTVWTDKNGKKQYKEQVIADEIKIIETYADDENEAYETLIIDEAMQEIIKDETLEKETNEPYFETKTVETEEENVSQNSEKVVEEETTENETQAVATEEETSQYDEFY